MRSKPVESAPPRTGGAVVVRVPGLLRSYTGGAAQVRLADLPAPATLAAALAELDRRFPGVRFRIVDEQDALRPHIKIFVDGEPVRALAARLPAGAELIIVGALSGG